MSVGVKQVRGQQKKSEGQVGPVRLVCEG